MSSIKAHHANPIAIVTHSPTFIHCPATHTLRKTSQKKTKLHASSQYTINNKLPKKENLNLIHNLITSPRKTNVNKKSENRKEKEQDRSPKENE
jgi:hypothetical protein